MKRELLCSYNRALDIFENRFSEETNTGAVLEKLFNQPGVFWLFFDDTLKVANLQTKIEPYTLLGFLRVNFKNNIDVIPWSLYKVANGKLELWAGEWKLQIMDFTREVQQLVDEQRPLTNVEVYLGASKGDGVWIYREAAKKLKEAGYPHVAADLLGRHIRSPRTLEMTGNRTIDRYLDRIQLVGKYVRFVLDENEEAVGQ